MRSVSYQRPEETSYQQVKSAECVCVCVCVCVYCIQLYDFQNKIRCLSPHDLQLFGSVRLSVSVTLD